MSSMLKRAAMAGTLAACAALAAPAMAQTTMPAQPQQPAMDQPRSTTVEFRTATRLPGITLEPGTYTFRLGDPMDRQRVVHVYSSDGTRKITTLLTVDYPTPMIADQSIVVYDRTTPQALRAWYFPGEPIGRAFVYSQDEANTIYATANTPVLWATWNPDDDTLVGSVTVQEAGSAVGQAARAVGNATKDVAQDIADAAQDVWDDITDNVALKNPTETRKMAERHLDAAEKTYDTLDERLDDAQEAQLMGLEAQLEALEDAFEDDDAAWMTHYTSVMATLDRVSPERPVGTSGGTAALDVTSHAMLGTLRMQLKSFHAQAMIK
jgi:hypothetical protein